MNTLYHMFVLFTASNSPDVFLPSYETERSECIFFIVYMFIIIGFFAYTEHHKRQSPHARSPSRAAFVELSQIDAALDDSA